MSYGLFNLESCPHSPTLINTLQLFNKVSADTA